jgi:diphosphomevalonate decarboxylase
VNSAFAIAHANIALAKYWGKAQRPGNYPAVPSLSMTLDRLATHTRVTFNEALTADELYVEGDLTGGRPLARVSALLERVRQESRSRLFARVDTRNNFPTAAGLASSASGFAALALAARCAAGLEASADAASALARESSASAARSIFGGFATLELGADAAAPLIPEQPFDVRLLVAVTASGEKSISSTVAMERTRDTSPYYAAWLEAAPDLYRRIREATQAADFAQLGPLVEQSALMMHASMQAASPAIIYWNGATLNAMDVVRRLRDRGVGAYFTMDAGPHVKVLTLPDWEAEVESALDQAEGVRRVIRCTLGPAANVEA